MLSGLVEYVLQNLIALDQQANTLTGGKADETLSSRAYRTEQKGRVFGRIFRPIIDGIFFWQYNHCYNAFLDEVKRKQLPSSFSKLSELSK